MSSPCPGRNRPRVCQPIVLVLSAFCIMSMFSASRASRKRTTCFAFSLVMVQPKSESTVILRAVKIVDRGKIALCQAPSRLKAISIFSSPVSILFKRCVNMIGVLQTITGRLVFSSIRRIPPSEYIQPSGCLRFTGAPLITSGMVSARSSRFSFLAPFKAPLIMSWTCFSPSWPAPLSRKSCEGSFTPKPLQLQVYTSPINSASLKTCVIFCKKVSPPLSGST